MVKYITSSKRHELPEEFSEQEANALESKTYYPSHFYNAVVGIKRTDVALKDFERGIINPDEVRFRGIYRPFQKRLKGQKARMMIRGRELKRIYKEGRVMGLHMKALKERAL